MRAACCVVLLLACVRDSLQHGMISNPAPRTGTQIAGGNKGNVGPCGGTDTAGASTATLTAGATIQIAHDLRANHGGPIDVRISPGKAGEPAQGTFQAAGNIANSRAAANGFPATVPAGLPAGPAVLQWEWIGDAPYFDCADITIAAAAGGTGGTGGTGNAAAGGTAGSSTGNSSTLTVLLVIVVLGILLVCYCRRGKTEVKAAGGPPPVPGRGMPPAVPPPPSRRVTTMMLFAYSKPGDPAHLTVPAQAVVAMAPNFHPGPTDAWLLVEYNGQTGYVPRTYTQMSQP